MRMRGIDDARLARLTAPAGPDAGAKTPGEIALVAIVGVLALLRGRAQLPAIPGVQPVATDAPVLAPQRPSSRPEVDAAAPGAMFVNPVCGVAVDTAMPKHIEKYEGVVYYFCCDGCLTTFRQNPAKYAAIHRASAGRVST
jgi:xanthine dehydrogenase accessory factor